MLEAALAAPVAASRVRRTHGYMASNICHAVALALGDLPGFREHIEVSEHF